MTDKYYIVSKTYHYTTEDNKIVLIEVGSSLSPSFPEADKYITSATNNDNQLIVCFLDARLVESNPEFFTLCSGNETVLYSLLDDLDRFFKERETEDGLAEKTYQRILGILKIKDEIAELKQENSRLQNEIFVLKLNNGNYWIAPSTAPWTQPYNPNPLTPPYGNPTSQCSVCGIDFSKNTNYVCLSSACPSRIMWSSSAVGTTTFESPTSTKVSFTNAGITGTNNIQ
jgi:hypothetical protein